MREPDPKPAREPSAEDPPGARPYPAETASARPQGRRSPGGSEPGDMGDFDDKTDAAPPRASPGDKGGTGYRGG